MSLINRGSRGTCASGVFISMSRVFVGRVEGGGKGYDSDVVEEEEEREAVGESPHSEEEEDVLLSATSVSGGVGGKSPPIRRGMGAFAVSEGIDDLLSVDGVGMSP